MKKYALLILVLTAFITLKAQNIPKTTTPGYNFDSGWQFIKDADSVVTPALFTPQAGKGWSAISLPHTANIEPVVKIAQQWQGICMYRKFFKVPAAYKGKYIAIQIDAAMSDADVYLNGKFICNHIGGYLPFRADISPAVSFSKTNCLVIKLNNRDNAEIPPGKPIKTLDFNYYGGIYRNAWLVIKNKVHISDAVDVDHVNSGGILVNYTDISLQSAQLHIKSEVKNDNNKDGRVRIKTILRNAKGEIVAQNITADAVLTANGYRSFSQDINIANPSLWSPETPVLYSLSEYVMNGNKSIDSVTFQTGIRDISFKPEAFYLNGTKYMIRGTDRHQEYPYIGNALSDNAQYRDAYKIKQAGFNFVRCSHYPPSPAFLDACDELGLLVMDSTPGWQFFGDSVFQVNSLKNIRDMVHRDRNHASVVVWESSLNETDMKRDYMVKANAEVHTELPFKTTFTCGWIDDVFDVFIPARQHAKAPDYWKKYNKDKPLLIAEYGDWEYYAQNAGFNQTEYHNLKQGEKSSRQVRGYGEERLLQQALNYQEAHNDNLYNRMVGDLIWLMFDYKRGYADDLQTSGIMDFFRVPKFSYYFFQSQKDAGVSKPMLFIANYWNNADDKTVKIYSNCQQVELFLDGQTIGKQQPDTGRNANNLAHAPFTFHLPAYKPGQLTAIGYMSGQKVITEDRATPETAYKIVLKADTSGKLLKAGCNDALFVYAYVTDKNGTVVPDATNSIKFLVNGTATIIGDTNIKAEAGIAAILLKAGDKAGAIKVTAVSEGLKTGEMHISSKK
jgi:beta-galactosidase